MMEPLGVFSSACTAADLCVKLLSLCKDVKHAETEINQLRGVIENLQRVLKNVEELRGNPNSMKLQFTNRLADTIHETQSLLKDIVNALSPEKTHKVMQKLKLRSLKWPFEKQDIQMRMSNLERYMQIINEVLKLDQMELLLEMDYKAVLDRLPIANGACFDSFNESRKPKCLPDTRVDLLKDIFAWVNDQDSHIIFWLNGMAGTGKSTISRTICETLAAENQLGASFFFKRGEGDRGGLERFFTTIAADFAQKQKAYAPHIKAAIDADPIISTKSSSEQFDKLITDPLNISKASGAKSPLVIVVDGLDECGEDTDIQLLIHLFSRSLKRTTSNLKFFVTSRPELPLRLGFKKIKGKYEDLILHEIPAPIIEEDIFKYLKFELSNIRNDYNLSNSEDPEYLKELKLPNDWPQNTEIKTLVKMAAPLFIIASTTCRYIADRKRGDPQRQLQRILLYQMKSQLSQLEATYLPILDQQIDGLSNSEMNSIIEEFQAIIGTVIILANPLTATALSHMLEIPRSTVINRLDMLHSVLNISSSPNIPVRLLHLSFRDFLLDPEKQGKTPFWVDEKQAHARMMHHCLRVLDNLKSDICGFNAPGTEISDIARETIDNHLAPELQYACLYWVYHAQQSQSVIVDNGEVGEFLLRHFLHWIEALSLMGRIWEAISFISVLQTLIEPRLGIELSDFLHDAKRFMLAHVSTIESWPLQIYSSALVFTPMESIVKYNFKDHMPPWLSFPPLVEQKWDSCLQVWEGHSKTVQSIAFSHDSTLVASASLDGTIRIWLASTGNCLQEIKEQSGTVSYINFSPDSSLLLSISTDYSIRIWRPQTGDCVRTLRSYTSDPMDTQRDYIEDFTSAAFSHNGRFVVSGHQDNTVRIWNVDTGECMRQLLGHKKRVQSVVFSHDSTLVASVSRDKTARIWNTDSGACKHVLRHAKNSPYKVFFRHDSKLLASFSTGNFVRFWQVDTGSCERIIQLENNDVDFWISDLSQDWNYILSHSSDKIQIWHAGTENCTQTIYADGHRLATFSHDSAYFASASEFNEIGYAVYIWDTMAQFQNRIQEQSASAPILVDTWADTWADAIDEISISDDLITIASIGRRDNSVMIWSAETGSCIQQIRCRGERVLSIAFSHDSSLLASFSRGSHGEYPHDSSGYVCIWQVDTGVPIQQFCVSVNRSTKSAFSSDLKFFASSLGDAIEVWCMDSGVCVQSLTGRGVFASMIFSSSSSMLGSATYDGAAYLWDAGTGKRVYEKLMPRPTHIRFSHDLALIAFVYDSDISVWRVDTDICIQTFKGPASICSSSFAYDSSFIVAETRLRELFIWHLKTGEQMRCLKVWKVHGNWKHEAGKRLLGNAGLFYNKYESRELEDIVCHRRGFSISSDGRWIVCGENNLLRLPKKYETDMLAIGGATVALGYNSTKVIIISVSIENLPDL